MGLRSSGTDTFFCDALFRAAQDLLYADELEQYCKSGVIQHFQPAYFEKPGPNGEVRCT